MSRRIEIDHADEDALSNPAASTPRSAAMATANSARLKRQMLRRASTWISPVTAISTTAARTGCGGCATAR